MGIVDKAKNAAQDLGGTVEETIGKVTGDESREAEGHKEQTKAEFKKTGEDIKDVVTPD